MSEIIFQNSAGSAVLIKTNVGIRQGCAMSPAFYSIVQSKAYHEVARECPDVINFAIIDDGYLAGNMNNLQDLGRAFKIIEKELDKVGLTLSKPKTKIYCKSEKMREREQEIKDIIGDVNIIPKEEGLKIGGTAVGSIEFIKKHFLNRKNFVTEKLDTLLRMARKGHNNNAEKKGERKSYQTAFYIIRLAFPSLFNHLQRTTHPYMVSELVREFDVHLFEGTLKMLGIFDGIKHSDLDYQTISLLMFGRLIDGGMGLTSLELNEEAAYWGSWALVGKKVKEILHLQ